MAKVIVTFNGLVQQEQAINKSRITIGRRPSNDLVIDHLTVSGQHAAIDTSSSGSFILDLGSTNGTMVNGQPVKKHLLQNDDVIEIGKYKLRFQLENEIAKPAQASASTSVKTESLAGASAKVKVLSGSNAGKELVLSKPLTTIGRPGVQVVVLTRQGDDYFIACIEGEKKPMINGEVFDDKPRKLKHHDQLDLSGTKMVFIAA